MFIVVAFVFVIFMHNEAISKVNPYFDSVITLYSYDNYQ